MSSATPVRVCMRLDFSKSKHQLGRHDSTQEFDILARLPVLLTQDRLAYPPPEIILDSLDKKSFNPKEIHQEKEGRTVDDVGLRYMRKRIICSGQRSFPSPPPPMPEELDDDAPKSLEVIKQKG
eukprot:GHVU01013373.1.p1 GENE.GHVU01013373.1~~GHVU01013373.1.p1  ORF type:complete len:144 (-),score=12.30 GHVU01013373.1:128-499(-)